MLQLKVVTAEGFDDDAQRFVEIDSVTLELEHSLLSVSKWESKWEVPFLNDTPKTDEQTRDYVHMMTSSGEIPPEVFQHMSAGNFGSINTYINAKMSATTFREVNHPKNNEIVTSELIYYWMIALGIPFECEKWHLSRLIALIKICNVKNSSNDKPAGKAPKTSAAERRAMNDQRRRETGSNG